MAPSDLLAGRYLAGRAIAEGATSVVHEATHAVTGRRGALKIARVATSPDVRFEQEARALGAIRHGNVVTIHDAGTLADGRTFLSLELLEGKTLDAVLATGRTLTAAHVAAIGVQLGEALAAAHACGVLHRDVRPANVMVVADDAGGEAVKLIDFGSAAPLAGPASEDESGEAEYLPLERLDRRGELDIRSDVFSLAVTLYELVHGDVPVHGTREELIAQRTAHEAPRLDDSSVPPELANVLARALARDVADRWPSARAFARALAPFAAGTHARLLPSSIDDVIEVSDESGQAPPPLPGARRRFPRAAWVAPVAIFHDGGEALGEAEDLSEGGMLVVTAKKFPNCTQARVRFCPPGHATDVELAAAVRWVRRQRRGSAFGVEFVDAPSAVRDAIAAFVKATSKR